MFKDCIFTFLEEEDGKFKLRFESIHLLMPRVRKIESDGKNWKEIKDLNSITHDEEKEFIRRNL